MNIQVEREVKVSPKEVVTGLRERVSKSPVFSAMAHIFAMRERTRQQIVLTTLYNTMVKEGFKYSKQDYAKELEFLANLGIGRLERDKKNRVFALKGIKITLQSIGLSAMAQQDQLSRAHTTMSFAKLPPVPTAAPRVPVEPKKGYKAVLVIENANGTKSEITLSHDLTAEKLVTLIEILQGVR